MALDTVWLNVTNACNLGCRHCAFSSGSPAPNELTTDEMLAALQQMKASGARQVIITGGEPLMRRDIWQIIEYCLSINLKPSMITNGTLLPDMKFERHVDLLRQSDLAASLDGFSPESNDPFRGVPGAFQRTKEFLEKCSEHGIRVALNTVLTALNVHELPAMIKWVTEDLGHFHRILMYEPHGRGEQGLFELPLAKTMAFFNDVFFPLYREHIQRFPKARLTCDLPVAFIPPDLNMAHTCSWGIIAGMAADGSIGYCHQCLDIPGMQVTNIRETRFQDVWQGMEHDEVKTYHHERLKGICGNCVAASWCRGRCRASAYMTYQDHFAPDVICQVLYENGFFPEYAMDDPTRDCRMPLPPAPEDELPVIRTPR